MISMNLLWNLVYKSFSTAQWIGLNIKVLEDLHAEWLLLPMGWIPYVTGSIQVDVEVSNTCILLQYISWLVKISPP